jgi:hypothetical protein
MKYVEKHFHLRIHRRDGKLLLGVTGRPPQVGATCVLSPGFDWHSVRAIS